MNNNIAIHGKLAFDPELRYTGEGKAICKLRIPVYAGKNKAGEYNPSLWVQVVLWDDAAEAAASFAKGDKVRAEGILGYEEWEKKDGTKQGSYTITRATIERDNG